MPFQFTQQERNQIDTLQSQAEQLGRFDAVYRYIRDVVAQRGGGPNSEPLDVAQSRRWFAGAEQANAGEGIFSAFIRLYSLRQYLLHYLSHIGRDTYGTRRVHQFAAAALLILVGCAGPGLFAGEPMGKQLDRALEEIKKDCVARGAPPFGPGSGQYNDTSCLMFTLKPWEPGDSSESAFAHAIKLPSPHDKLKDVYKAAMSSEEYFKALCEAEAGEWVFRRVESVRGITQDRSVSAALSGYVPLVFYVVEKGEHNNSTPQDYLVQPTLGNFDFVEVKLPLKERNSSKEQYRVYRRIPESQSSRKYVTALNGKFVEVPYVVNANMAESSNSNFAFTSRGIRRVHDRENAIDGYELILFQKQPFEVVAFRRTYFRYYVDHASGEKKSPPSQSCPNSRVGAYQFIQQVFQPISR